MLEDKNFSPTPINELGEFGLQEHLTKGFKNTNSSTKLGIGDDCAVIASKQETLLSTKTYTEGVHFNLNYFPLKHLGYKSIMATISDIYAMNGKAQQIMVNLCVSNRFGLEAMDDLYTGIHAACKNYELDLVGSKTTSSRSGLIISITAIGGVDEKKKTLRSGAKENDLLVTTGDLGAAYLGLQVLERENEVWKVNPQTQPDLSAYTYLVQRQLKPEARKDIIALFENLDLVPTAMIDLSDGLASDSLHLAQQNDLGIRIFEDKLPMDPTLITTAEEFNIHPTVAALNGGEDYELLFSIDLKDHDKIKANPHLTVIGHFTSSADGNYMIGKGGENAVPLTAQAWDKYENYKKKLNEEVGK